MTEKPAMSLAQSVAQCLESHADLPEHARFVSSVNRAILERQRTPALEKSPTPIAESVPDQSFHRDAGKPRWSLVPVRAMRSVLAVLEFGARKYAARSYLRVPHARERYTESLMRHAMAVLEAVQERGADGVTVADEETGEPHLAHLACDALILLDLAAQERDP
jgi:hypothetical protein